jgi:hypothetical protein
MIIGRGRRREHPKDISKGVTWPSVTTGVAHPREPRRGSNDLWSHPVAMLLLLRKKHGKRPGMRRTYCLFRSHDFVTSGQKTPLGQILRNFWLRMRRTYFRTGHVTDVTSGSTSANMVLSVPIYYSPKMSANITSFLQKLFGGRHGRDRMVVGLQLHLQSVPITTKVVRSNPAQSRRTRYNIMWW